VEQSVDNAILGLISEHGGSFFSDTISFTYVEKKELNCKSGAGKQRALL
jgi:hypothetical protein